MENHWNRGQMCHSGEVSQRSNSQSVQFLLFHLDITEAIRSPGVSAVFVFVFLVRQSASSPPTR